jgi:hypothetical protein
LKGQPHETRLDNLDARRGRADAAPAPRRHGAVITPTQQPGLGAALRRLADRVRDRLRAEPPERLDGAALRDLGLSHGAIAAAGVDPHAARRGGAAQWLSCGSDDSISTRKR